MPCTQTFKRVKKPLSEHVINEQLPNILKQSLKEKAVFISCSKNTHGRSEFSTHGNFLPAPSGLYLKKMSFWSTGTHQICLQGALLTHPGLYGFLRCLRPGPAEPGSAEPGSARRDTRCSRVTSARSWLLSATCCQTPTALVPTPT